MGLLFKLILFTLLFAFVVYVFKMIARLAHKVRATITDVNKLKEVVQTAAQGRPQVSADMVRCQACGSFVASKEAVVITSRQRKEIFCSHECVQRRAV